MTALTKRCPYCAEEILLAAIKCKHCQSDVPASEASEASEEAEHAPPPIGSPDGNAVLSSLAEQPRPASVLQRPVSPWVVVAFLAVLVVLFFGNFHVVSGKSGTTIVRRESFGYSEAFINVDAITSMPWMAAKARYPLGCRVLQREGIIESDEAFRARVERETRERMEKAMREAQEQTRRLLGR